jgi:predicted molibdopterin-dependent oxidoreductase YjgC
MAMIRLSINGREIETEEGKTILHAARENGIYIPTLCFHENLLPIGSCRLCIVEVEGYANPVTSCNTTAVNGISVRTHSDRLLKMRQDYLKLLLIHHPLDCPICDAGGECDLQDLVFAHKIEKVDLRATRVGKKIGYYATPLIRYSEDRCVLCLRCVHACREISGRTVLDLVERGIEAKMSPVNGIDCISCGECLSVCPVGALTENVSPIKSRFWQVKRTRTTCPHCGFGCSFDLDVFENRYVTNVITGTGNLPNKGSLCVLGRFGYDFVNHEAKLKEASVRSNGTQKPCTIDKAVQITAESLGKLDAAGKGVGFIVSSRATNEEICLTAEISGLLKKSVVASPAAYHTGKVFSVFKEMGVPLSYEYDDLKNCDLIIVAGASLLANNHLLANKVREAFKLNGSRIIVIDPTPTALTRIADVHLAVKPGQDAALFNTLSLRLIEENRYAPEAGLLKGFAGLTAAMERWKTQSAEAGVDVPEARLEKAYRLIRDAGSVAVILGSGVTSSADGLSSLINLTLLKGFPGKGAIMPVACESNAVGVVSILGNPVSPLDVIRNPEVKGLVIVGDDPFHYLNEDQVREGLANKEFILVADALPTRVMEFAHVIVPSGTFAEKNGTCVAEDGYVRTLNRAMDVPPYAFLFLKDLLSRLGGTRYGDAVEVFAKLNQQGFFESANGGRKRVAANGSSPRFYTNAVRSTQNNGSGYKLVLRNLFMSHLLMDVDVYAKGIAKVCTGTSYPISENKLFVSPEDARELGLSPGDAVKIESPLGSMQHPVTVKDGLRQGVLEYISLKDRQQALKLTAEPARVIDVTVKKA